MGARWYDPELGRFVSPDTIVPDPANPQSLNRYSWVLGNPLKYTDPTGHKEDGACGLNGEDCIDPWTPWDPNSLKYVEDPGAAGEAYLHYLTDPGYFVALYADTPAWNASQEVADLEVFAGYSRLGTTAENLVLSGLDSDTAAGLQSAHFLGGLGTEEGSKAFVAAAGLGFVPNPNGKRGGALHQAGIEEIIADIKGRELGWRTEFRVDTPGGMKPYRFIDVAALDVEGNPVEFWQVGRVTQEGMPVARERYAIGDVFLNSDYGSVPLTYAPYYGKYQR